MSRINMTMPSNAVFVATINVASKQRLAAARNSEPPFSHDSLSRKPDITITSAPYSLAAKISPGFPSPTSGVP